MRAALSWWSALTFVVLWLGFAILLLADGDGIESVDDWLERQPAPVRVVLWVLFLPIAVGLKVWNSSSAPIRWLGLVALIVWTVASAASLKGVLAE